MDGPTGVSVPCPRCDNTPLAIVPENSEIIQEEKNADGKVRVYCRECGEKFLVNYRTS